MHKRRAERARRVCWKLDPPSEVTTLVVTAKPPWTPYGLPVQEELSLISLEAGLDIRLRMSGLPDTRSI